MAAANPYKLLPLSLCVSHHCHGDTTRRMQNNIATIHLKVNLPQLLLKFVAMF